MKKKTMKRNLKLQLSRETLHALDTPELRGIVAGASTRICTDATCKTDCGGVTCRTTC